VVSLAKFFLFSPPSPLGIPAPSLPQTIHTSSPATECGQSRALPAAQARAIAAIRRQLLSCDLPFCREGHRNPLAPSANTRRKAASIHYQSNNHAIPNTAGRTCPVSRKKIVKILLNLARIGTRELKTCANARFSRGKRSDTLSFSRFHNCGCGKPRTDGGILA